MVVSITAVFTLWWYGAFLPRWISWEEKEFFYEGGEVILKNRTLRVVKTDMGEAGDRHRFMKRDQSEHIWKTPADWQVQDVLVMDIDRDQQEELVLLVWKHGSYGRHLPVWEKKNDIRLEQHIFIYRLQEYPEQNNEYVKVQDEEADKIIEKEAAEGKDRERNISTDVMRPVGIYKITRLGLSLTFIPGKTVLLRIVQVPAGSGRTLDLNMQESQRSSRLRWSVQVII